MDNPENSGLCAVRRAIRDTVDIARRELLELRRVQKMDPNGPVKSRLFIITRLDFALDDLENAEARMDF